MHSYVEKLQARRREWELAGWTRWPLQAPIQFPFPSTLFCTARTVFSSVASHPGQCQWQMGVVEAWKGQQWHQNTWVCTHRLHRSLCVHLPPPSLLPMPCLSLSSAVCSGIHGEPFKRGKWTQSALYHSSVLWGHRPHRATLLEIKKSPKVNPPEPP